MLQDIKELVLIVSKDVENLISSSYEKIYYEKMSYSNKNVVLQTDSLLLKRTISLEVAFVHIIIHFMCKVSGVDFEKILKIVDKESLYSWYRIKNSIVIDRIKKTNVTFSDIYQLINEHDTLINKDIKKKLGQFYTPVGIVQKMIKELRNKLKSMGADFFIIDPACGTGVFVVEIINLLKKWMSIDELILFVNKSIFAYDVNPFAVVTTRINVLNILLELSNMDTGTVLEKIILDNIQWKNNSLLNK